MTLAFNHDFEPRHGEAVTVAPGVRRVTAGNAGPFTFHGTNTFLIGEDDLAVLDPGPADPAHIDALLRAIGEARVATSSSRIPIATIRPARACCRRERARRSSPPALIGRRGRCTRGEPPRLDAGADLDFAPDETLPDGAIVEAGGFRLEAVATPGHTANHLAFALPDTGILFSGDHVMGWSTTVVAPPDGSMGDYMASLDRLLARPESLYFPAHGGEIRDAQAYVRGLRAHRKMRERAILKRLERGDRTIPEMVAAHLSPASTRGSPARRPSRPSRISRISSRAARGERRAAGARRVLLALALRADGAGRRRRRPDAAAVAAGGAGRRNELKRKIKIGEERPDPAGVLSEIVHADPGGRAHVDPRSLRRCSSSRTRRRRESGRAA